MPVYIDQLHREIILPLPPKRIISLVPSQTEFLFDLGLEDEVIGITKFCKHPEKWFRNKTRIGGTKTVKIDLIASLKPDLIIANKEENVQDQITALEKIAPVWISDISTVIEAYQMMNSLGELTGKLLEATTLVMHIQNELAVITRLQKRPYRTAYLIWKDPYMSAGSDTFINDMMLLSGFENVLMDQTRYPVITIEELKARNTELVLLSSEPYPFKQKHMDEIQKALPNAKIHLVDGEIFSWYGTRMQYAGGYIKKLLNDLYL